MIIDDSKIDKIDKTKIIVTTNGAFDILHIGHIRLLEEAKMLGDTLIVCLNSDDSIKKYKAKDRPKMPQNERALIIDSLRCVDYVIIFNEPDPNKILDKIKPNIHVKSVSGYKGIEKETVEKNGGGIILIPDIPNHSTTNIINKIKNS